MKYIVSWTNSTKIDLQEILDYYLINENFSIAKNLLNKILKSVTLLERNPKLGKSETLLDGDYRFIQSGIYKIVYKINNKRIYIIAIFDSRRNPDELVI